MEALESSPQIIGETASTARFRSLRWPATIGLLLYLAWTSVQVGIRFEHLLISALFGFLFWWSEKSSLFAQLCLPFLGVGIAYENLPLLFDLRGPIHVSDLYHLEQSLFGVGTQQTIPPFALEAAQHPVLDFFSGLAYITYLAETFVLGAFFFFRDKQRLATLSWAFLLVNLMGMATWIIYPAAPPWYVAQHGLGEAVMSAAPSAAGAARFDALVGVGVFEGFYSRNANVFGAMPSLHCAYPTIVVLVCWKLGPIWRAATTAFMLLVCFAAVYLQHHYVLDVILGVVFAVLAYVLTTQLQRRLRADRAREVYNAAIH